MTVNILDADALNKMAQLEGDDWRHDQEIGRGVFNAFKERCRALLAVNAECGPQDWIEIDRDSCIGGFGGYNRYFVRANGEMVFAKNNAKSRADISKAEELGFESR